MSDEPGVPKSDRQEPGGSTSDCLMLIPKDICPKSNRQEPRASKHNHLTIVLKKIYNIQTHNNITAPFKNNKYETYIMQKCNGFAPKIRRHHQKYVYVKTLCTPFVSHLITGVRLS